MSFIFLSDISITGRVWQGKGLHTLPYWKAGYFSQLHLLCPLDKILCCRPRWGTRSGRFSLPFKNSRSWNRDHHCHQSREGLPANEANTKENRRGRWKSKSIPVDNVRPLGSSLRNISASEIEPSEVPNGSSSNVFSA